MKHVVTIQAISNMSYGINYEKVTQLIISYLQLIQVT